MGFRWKIGLALAALFIIAAIIIAVLNLRPGKNGSGDNLIGASMSPLPGGATENSPYGFTTRQVNFTDRSVEYMHDLRLTWVRAQLDWANIEVAEGVYDWTLLDATVKRANAGNVNLVFPIRNGPPFRLKQTCVTESGLNSKQFPGPAEMAHFAGIVAERYNGRNGHGRITALQIGNEEWDDARFGDLAESVQCRHPRYYGPVLAAAYDAIKQVDPHILVIGTGLFWRDLQHIYDWFAYLYENGYAHKFDVGAFHYYLCNYDPAIGNGSAWPRFAEMIDVVRRASEKYGVKKPIWVTETGWNINANNQKPECIVSEEQISQYMTSVFDTARTSGLIAKVFWFTLDQNTNGMSITQGTVKTHAYQTLREYIRKNPQSSWSDP